MPEGPPLVIDMATSAVTKGSILARKAAGETTVPEGWATDRDGTPTTDVDAAIAGNVAPMGGAKGAALAMMVEVMAACVGGGALSARCSTLLDAEGPPPDLAATALVLDPAALSGGLYAQQITALMAEFDACAGARLPGARRHEARAAAERDGLTVPAALLDRIRAIADGAPAAG